MTLTLAQTKALNFEALWSGLPRETQLRLGAALLRSEFLCQIEIDGGFHASHEDQNEAAAEKDEILNRLPGMVEAAFPDLLPVVYDESYPLWEILDGRAPPTSVAVRGMAGRRRLIKDGFEWFVSDEGRMIQLGGAVDLNSGPVDKPYRWQFWTVEQVDAERARRHPELAENIRHVSSGTLSVQREELRNEAV